MSFFELTLLSVALSMDAFAVSVSEGIRMTRLRHAHALKAALLFGAFQAIMPVIGFVAGTTVHAYIESIDHWVAMGLLSFIGIRMIIEACRRSKCETAPACVSNTRTLIVFALATSIDALAVGISLAIQHADILFCAVIIGCITLAICYFGVILGRRLGCLFQKRAEIIGGLVLVGIGINVLLEHLLA